MKRGRPSKYTKTLCEGLIKHLEQGFSYETFAAVCDCNVDTLYEWEKRHPEFSEAKKRGWIKSQYKWEQMALDSIHDPHTLNTTLWIFNMKNRFGWRDTVDVEERSYHTHVVVTSEGKEEFPV